MSINWLKSQKADRLQHLLDTCEESVAQQHLMHMTGYDRLPLFRWPEMLSGLCRASRLHFALLDTVNGTMAQIGLRLSMLADEVGSYLIILVGHDENGENNSHMIALRQTNALSLVFDINKGEFEFEEHRLSMFLCDLLCDYHRNGLSYDGAVLFQIAGTTVKDRLPAIVMTGPPITTGKGPPDFRAPTPVPTPSPSPTPGNRVCCIIL